MSTKTHHSCARKGCDNIEVGHVINDELGFICDVCTHEINTLLHGKFDPTNTIPSSVLMSELLTFIQTPVKYDDLVSNGKKTNVATCERASCDEKMGLIWIPELKRSICPTCLEEFKELHVGFPRTRKGFEQALQGFISTWKEEEKEITVNLFLAKYK